MLNNVLYDPFGPINGWSWGNSTLAVRTYNEDGLVTAIDSAGLKQYGYDDAFRITGITDAQNGNLSWAHQFDPLDRLTQATKTGTTQTWTYDANGNRLTQGGSTSSTFTVSTTSNRLSGVSGALSRTYGYDSAGNTTSYSGLTFGYNDAGRMTSVSGGATATYAHNALGQRVKKVTGGSTTYFVYDEAGHLVGEYDGAGALIQETVWLGDIPVATLRPNGGSVAVYYVHTDHLNTPRRVSRPSDNVIAWRWDSDPFGTTAASQDPDGDSTNFVYNPRFPGQYYDAETGLNYNYFRDYDSQTGRYVESDPIGLNGGTNTYTYSESAPTELFDHDGRAATSTRRRGGFVDCDSDGNPRARLDRLRPEYWRCGMAYCMIVHELSHVDDLVRSNQARQCRFLAAGKLPNIRDRPRSESKGYRVEYQCLLERQKQFDVCQDCWHLIESRKQDVLEQKSFWESKQ